MSQSIYTFIYIPHLTANRRIGQQKFPKALFSIKKLLQLMRFICVVKVYIKHNQNSPAKAAGTLSPASKHLS